MAGIREEGSLGSPKEDVKKMLEQLPDDASLEDIQYHIFVFQKVQKGVRDVDEGRVLSQEEVEARMAKWLVE